VYTLLYHDVSRVSNYTISLEAEFEAKLKEMKERHDMERLGFPRAGGGSDSFGAPKSEDADNVESLNNEEEEEERQRRMEKSRKKREKAREKEREREQRIAEETANAGPSARDVENQVIQQQLTPLNLCIHEVAADGHCLYRSVAAHCGTDYTEMRTSSILNPVNIYTVMNT
jgi:OTU domain-containing protein 6